MKYLLLDTNIYLNIAVNRRKDINNNLLETFSKLLQYGEITIVLPAIVRHETFRHLENEIAKVGNNLENAKKSVEDIYWVNGIDQGTFSIDNCKKNSKNYIQKAYDYFNENKEDYILKLENQINSIFESEYTIFVDDNEKIINKALKRKIYKKAPCHKKESYADSIIAEVLINLDDYIDMNENDTVYFISDNSEDFSKNKGKDKQVLHPDISKDLEERDLLSQVEYGTNFNKLIMNDLADEIENANLKQEFEREFEEEEGMKEYEYYNYLEDMNRESAGLPSLSSSEEWIIQTIDESREIKQILSLFEMINEVYVDLEEIHSFYWDELPDILKHYMNEDSIEDDSIISKFNKFIIQKKINYYCYSIDDIIEWVLEQENQVNFEYDMRLPDYIDLYESTTLYDANRDSMYLSFEGTQLSPESGGTDTIYYNIRRGYSSKIVAEGRINIIYGFIEVLDSGNVGDGCQRDIDIYLGPVIEAIEDIYEDLDELRNKHKAYVDYIRDNVVV